MRISTLSAVLSSTCLILILPFALAARIDSISDLGGDAVGELGDGEQVLRALLDLRADLHLPAALAVVVFGKIGGAAGREIRENAERFPLQVIDRRAAEIVEIVRQDLRREADRDAVGAFEQHDGKLRRQRDRLLVAPVVAELPGRGLRVEEHVLREGREPRLDVTRRRRIVAGEECCRSCPAAR